MTAAGNGGVGSSISFNVLVEFIITSGNCVASSCLLSNTHTLVLASFTNQLSHWQSLSSFLPHSLYLSLSTLWLPWEWVDHTDLIRQPCSDEICTTRLSVPPRTYSRDSGSELALAWGQSKAAGSNLPSNFGEEQHLNLLSVRARLTGKISDGFWEKRKESMWKEKIGRVQHRGDTVDRSSGDRECVCVRGKGAMGECIKWCVKIES